MWIGKNGKQSPYYGNSLTTSENQVATNIKLLTTSFPRVIKNNKGSNIIKRATCTSLWVFLKNLIWLSIWFYAKIYSYIY